jgi:hypothetical protein
VHLAGNLVEPKWKLVTGPKVGPQLADKPLMPASDVTIDLADKARDRVLEGAGATRPKRDSVDQRTVEDVHKRTGKIIDSQKDVGGWPELAAGVPPVDADSDGMPDEWEQANGLGPSRADEGGDDDRDGYSNLEEWLNGTDPRRP